MQHQTICNKAKATRSGLFASSRPTMTLRVLSACTLLALGWTAAACSDKNNSDGNGGSGAGTGPNPPAGAGGVGSNGNGSPTMCASIGAGPGPMVEVPAGDFTMGCDAGEFGCDEEEQPRRALSLDTFQIDQFEVSQAEYASCVEAGACTQPNLGDKCAWNCEQMNLPAACLTRTQMSEYCAYAGKRLPSEAEWEKAARGGDGRTYPWGEAEPTCELTNMGNCLGTAATVDDPAFAAGDSPYGARHMAGNMVEVVADPWAEGSSEFVGKGGGWWNSTAKWLRAADRDNYGPTYASIAFGFRCAR